MKTSKIITRIGIVITLGAIAITVAILFFRGTPTGLVQRPKLDTRSMDSGGFRSSSDTSSLATLYRTINLVQKTYLDASRINPRAMLLSAMHNIQMEISQVLIEEKGDELIVQIGAARKVFKISDVTSPWVLLQRTREILDFIRSGVNSDEIVLADVEYAAINGMLQTLDPHTILLSPEIYRDMKDRTQGEFGGLGIVIAIRDGALTIVSPMDDTPAERAGLQAGDQVLRIDNASTVNMPLNDAVNLMRGPPGTAVTLQVLRDEWPEPRDIRITRAIIEVKSVGSSLMAGNIGYVRIKDFQPDTAKDLIEQLAKMEKKGPLKGLVLDLRKNPGGLLSAAIQVSDVFLKEGVVVTTAGQGLEMREVSNAQDQGFEPTWPIVLLVNSGSASASEIVAGALKNHNRAVLVGERTFGKGSVQVLHDFADGSALKITSAQYLTPGDLSIQSVGIAPHVATRPIRADKEVVDLKDQIQPRESDLSHHLKNGNSQNSPRDKSEVTLAYLLDPKPTKKTAAGQNAPEPADPGEEEEEENDYKFVFKQDFEIDLARDMVAQMSATRRNQFDAASFKPLFAAREQKESARLLAAFSKMGIDWTSSGTPAANPRLKTTISTAPLLKADTSNELSVSVTNEGDTAVERVLALTRSDYNPLNQRELAFGRILPGETITRTLPFKVTKNSWTATYDVRVSLETPEKTDIDVRAARFSIEALPKPRFAFSLQFLDTEKGNGDGLLQKGETASLLCWVRNDGQGTAFASQATLKNLSGRAIFLSKGREDLKEIPVGQVAMARFDFEVKADFDKQMVEFELGILDTVLMSSYTGEKIRLPLESALAVTSADGIHQVGKTAAPFFASPTAKEPALGTLAPGVVVRITGRHGERTRVALEDKVFAWVNTRDISPVDPAVGATDGSLSSQISRLFNSPPYFAMAASIPGVVRSSKITLRGMARDDNRVRDLYVFSGDEKVYFKAAKNSGEKEVSFEADVPLKPGINYISIVAEENANLFTRDNYIVRRDSEDGMPWVTVTIWDSEDKSEPLGVIPSVSAAVPPLPSTP